LQVHIDYYGLLKKIGNENRHLLIIVDAFTKFIRVYLRKLTTMEKSIKHLHDYFRACSKLKHLIR